MFSLRHGLLIQAPIERCFALSTHLGVVERELGMHPVEGRIGGLITGGDTVRWEGMQLGFANYHVSLVVPETWAPPHFFQDRMLAGRFRSFEHDHRFIETANGTFLDDCIRFTMPLGWAGDLVGRMILVPHILGLMRRRFALLQRLAETEEWRDYLPSFAVEPRFSSPHLTPKEVLHESCRPARVRATVQA
jgi:ligand-binding SRPBCC domain-containing protein